MLHSSKAKEIATIKVIEDRIRDAALKGDFQTSMVELSDDAKNILMDNGYDVHLVNDSPCVKHYDIFWYK